MYMYVDFAALLPSHKDDEDKIGEVLYENNNVTISNRKNKKDMFSIWQWANAYDIFMSIYLTNQSNSVLDLIKYGNNIRNMAKQFGSKKNIIESIKCRVCPFTEGPSSNSRLASAGLSV